MLRTGFALILAALVGWGIGWAQEPEQPPKQLPSAHFKIEQLLDKRKKSGSSYAEFLRVPALNCGIYHLSAETTDRQSPHLLDEIYYVVKGKSRFQAGEKDYEIGPGSVLYVKAEIEHRFHSIEEDLELLVVFAAAPSSVTGH